MKMYSPIIYWSHLKKNYAQISIVTLNALMQKAFSFLQMAASYKKKKKTQGTMLDNHFFV